MATESVVIIMGSPRAGGVSARIADELREQWAAQPGVEVELLSVPALAIAGCTGCDACRCDEGHACIIDDDMAQVNAALARAARLIVVSPVYFAGAPSQLKALLDRLQPHFWKETRKQGKRPAELHVVGEGGDPHGYEPLVVSTRSALAVAGFMLEKVHPHIAADADDARAAATAGTAATVGAEGSEIGVTATAGAEGSEVEAGRAGMQGEPR